MGPNAPVQSPLSKPHLVCVSWPRLGPPRQLSEVQTYVTASKGNHGLSTVALHDMSVAGDSDFVGSSSHSVDVLVLRLGERVELCQ